MSKQFRNLRYTLESDHWAFPKIVTHETSVAESSTSEQLCEALAELVWKVCNASGIHPTKLISEMCQHANETALAELAEPMVAVGEIGANLPGCLGRTVVSIQCEGMVELHEATEKGLADAEFFGARLLNVDAELRRRIDEFHIASMGELPDHRQAEKDSADA